MKKTLWLLIVIFFLTHTLSATVFVRTTLPFATVGKTSLNNFSVKDYQNLVGKKLVFRDKLVFYIAKYSFLKKKTKSFDINSFDKFVEDTDKRFTLGGFLLGFLGIPGLIIAAFIGKRHLRWALLGFGIAIMILLVCIFLFGELAMFQIGF